MIRNVLLGGALISLSIVSAGAETLPAPSTWINTRGSILSVTSVDASGSIAGTFINNAAGTECLGKSYDMGGKLTASRVRIAVTFTECRTVTVWRGNLHGATLATRFEAAFPDKNGRIQIWRGRDTFTKK